MALAKDVDIIICDEITVMLDETNPHEMIELLKEQSHQYHKIIIIATHEEAVMDEVDCLYALEYQQLRLVRTKEIVACARGSNKNVSISSNYLWRTAWARIVHHKVGFGLLLVVCSLVISLLWFSKAYADESKLLWQKSLDSISENELFITKKYRENNSGLGQVYQSYLPQFADGMADKLAKVDGIQAVYPYYGCSLITEDESRSMISLFQGDKLVNEISLYPEIDNTLATNSLYGDVVFPYFKERDMKCICSQSNEIDDGLYICQAMADYLEIKQLQSDMLLSFDVFVPAADYDYKGVDYYFPDGMDGPKITTQVLYNNVVYEKMILKMPIAGILDPDYYDPTLGDIWYFYIPQEKMQEMILQAKAMHDMAPMEYELKDKAYLLYFSSEVNREQLKKDILDIDEALVIKDNYANKVISQHSNKQYDRYLLAGSRFVFIVSAVLMLGYGIHHKQEVSIDEKYYLVRGIGSKEQKRQTAYEMWLLFLVLFICSTLIANVWYFHGINEIYRLLVRNTVSSTYLFMVALLSEAALLWKK